MHSATASSAFWLLSQHDLRAANDEDALAFFRVHQDKDKHLKAPTLYEALPVRNTTGREFYVERRAAHAVSDRALEAVVV